MIRKLTTLLSVTVIVLSLVPVGNAAAADARNYNAGRIIDDAVFTNDETMSVHQIQSFLNSKTVCDTYGTKPSELGGGTRAQWLAAHGISTPITCLRGYYENPGNGANNYGKAIPSGAISAAQIIYNYSRQFGINPQSILVTLQKENGLITDEWPTPKQFSEAMGFGCPDNVAPGAPACNPAYKSFSTQVYQAARHFRGFIDKSPGWWIPFDTGTNSIRWSPNTSCGAGNVNIENRSTVALYSYTPYQPNQAAKNAQYGTGNSCSAYGNRNFYLYFTDWFGSVFTNGNFMRSINNATVYLIGNGTKYPISDPHHLGAASVLGGVGFASQSYLDSIPTGSLLGRIIQGPDGTIYFYDANIKLPFTSCAMVSAYGGACGAAAELTQPQIDKLVTGPVVSRGMKTLSGRTYYIDEGKKREVLDSQSLQEAGISTGYNVLNDTAFNYLAVGIPYIRDNVIISSRQSSSTNRISIDGQVHGIAPQLKDSRAFITIARGKLDGSSINQLPAPVTTIDDVIDNGAGSSYILSYDGKRTIPDVSSFDVTSTPLPQAFINSLYGSGTLSNPSLVRSTTNATVYVLVDGEKRPLVSMEDLKSITGENNPYIAWTAGSALNSIPTGNIIVGAGRLVKTPTSATVYMTDGYNRLVPMSSFGPTSDMGINVNIRIIKDNILANYNIDGSVLGSYIMCNGKDYVGIGGAAYEISIGGLTARELEDQTCNVLDLRSEPPRFVQAPNGTIYELVGDTLHPITNLNTYLSLKAGGGATKSVSYQTVSLFHLGTAR